MKQNTLITLTEETAYKVKKTDYVSYRDFGAVGDGVTNDMEAIIAAHEYANANGLPVLADAGAKYYISDAESGAIIRTDTDWTGAEFIIDDSEINGDKRGVWIFTVMADQPAYELKKEKLTSIAKNADNLGVSLPQDSVVILTDETTRRFRRSGNPESYGSAQRDILVVSKDGSIDMRAPLNWDYEQISSVHIIPMDDKPLTIKGGKFTTIANNETPSVSYWCRGIQVSRSNVTIEGLEHYVTGEGEQGNPYIGFLQIYRCANVTVRDCIITPHKTYWCNGNMGTYDINLDTSANVVWENIRSSRDITNSTYWGIMGGNFYKNLTVDNCYISHVDAHQGCYNVTVRNTTLSRFSFSVVGKGTLLIENCTVMEPLFIYLKTDYGSTWEGDLIIRNCTWKPYIGSAWTGWSNVLFHGEYSWERDFGYPCTLPKNITIEGLYVDDSRASGPVYLFNDYTPEWTSEEYEKQAEESGRPFGLPEQITISGYSSASGKKWKLSPNTFMFRNVVVNDLDE